MSLLPCLLYSVVELVVALLELLPVPNILSTVCIVLDRGESEDVGSPVTLLF